MWPPHPPAPARPPGAAEACHIKFTVLEETRTESHKVKLMGVIVSDAVGIAAWEAKVRRGAGRNGRVGRPARGQAGGRSCGRASGAPGRGATAQCCAALDFLQTERRFVLCCTAAALRHEAACAW